MRLFAANPFGSASRTDLKKRDETLQNLYYLSEKGFTVAATQFTNNGMDGLAETRALTRWALQQERFRDLPVYLAGFGLGGRLAILDACYEAGPRIRGVAAIDAEADRPFPEISPKEQIGKLQAPLLMIFGENDRTGNSDKIQEGGQLAEMCKKRGLKAGVFIIPGVG